MTLHRLKILMFLNIFLLFTFTWLYAQTTDAKSELPEKVKGIEKLKVYISGDFNDLQYLEKQIPVVVNVNDRADADVHILTTSQTTAAGGTKYSLLFYEKNITVPDTILTVSNQNDSPDMVRKIIVNSIKSGLYKYLRKAIESGNVNIAYSPAVSEVQVNTTDPWDNWVFISSLSSTLSGESSSDNINIMSRFAARRVTEDFRLNFDVKNNYTEKTYKYNIDGMDYEYASISRSQELGISGVMSVSNHWSIGLWTGVGKSTYNNLNFFGTLWGGIEYNYFPYSESSTKQLRFAYKVGPRYNKYSEETIYFKEKENLFVQIASIDLILAQPWGSVGLTVQGNNYLHDMEKYFLLFIADLNLRITKGLSFTCTLEYTKVRDQITLARRGASVEDVLLKIRQLETQYSYHVVAGISFSFGSIFNRIVNPRFGG